MASSLKAALADPSARAILFDITSPGGVVAGTKGLADAIASADEEAYVPPTPTACASAAYWLASATGPIYAPLAATVGNIRVIDDDHQLRNWKKIRGISTVTITGGGKWKAAGQGSELTERNAGIFRNGSTPCTRFSKADGGVSHRTDG